MNTAGKQCVLFEIKTMGV